MNAIRKLQRMLYVMYFTIKSMAYDSTRPGRAFFDALFEPLFWFIDKGTSYVGFLMVIMVILLTTSVVLFWYKFLLPTILSYSSFWSYYHIIVAHYLLLNIVFHYFKAVSTNPGTPPTSKPIENIKGAIVCKHCVQPKPQRAHHCSICDCCFLKMDHHCPWMNNCIGYFNHRYFVSFCIFMWLGTVYVSTSCYNLFTYHFNHPGTLFDPKKRSNLAGFSFGFGPLAESLLQSMNINITFMQTDLEKKVLQYRPHPGGFKEDVHPWEHVGIIYLFLLTVGVTVALGALNSYHLFLISRGETSIEVHINRSERKKAAERGMGYNNPYHHGWKNNFRHLFGLNSQRSIFSILLPSSHKPDGDGMNWPNNKKPINYPDPLAYERYEKSKSRNIFKKIFPC